MRRSLYAAVIAASVALIGLARADTIHLEGGGVIKGTIIEEAFDVVKIRDHTGAVQTIPRSDIASIEKDKAPKEEFEKRFAEAKRKNDADELAKLGLWAREKKLEAEAKQCFELAVKLDSFCKAAREALGFKLYGGKWVTEEDYNRLARGLVRWNDQWVTPEDKEKLELGFVKNAEGSWERPEDRARREAEEEARRSGHAKKEDEKEPPPLAGEKPRPRFDEPPPAQGEEDDQGWYKDNASTGSFDTAAVTDSKYYKIRTNAKPEYAKRYATMLDGYFKLFLDVFKPEKVPERKSEVWIYSSQPEFQAATGMSQGVGGFYSTGTKRVTAFHGLFGMTGSTRTVLAHEGTHQFEDIYLGSSGFGNCPIWVLEGLAVFFESATFDGKQAHVGTVPRDRLVSLKRGHASGSLIPLAQLFRTPQPSFTAYHYAHAWGVIYMILYYHQDAKLRNRNLKLFDDLLTMSRTKQVSPEDVEKLLGGRDGVARFEDVWKKWIAELPYDFDPRKNVKK
jgi:hypothetical protein